jgi:hypothetical protein
VSRSSTTLRSTLANLTRRARSLGLHDAEWARRAGLPKETLSRLRGRESCDYATLVALARALGVRMTVVPNVTAATTADGHFPRMLDRDYEEELLRLAAAGRRDPDEWRALGPAFFMSGLAVMLASANESERRRYLELAEELYPGSTEPEVFRRWLERSPLRPSRFLPMLDRPDARRRV